ncbi:MAG TPA: response regulator transcription factor [Bryobacteraceae bacterium]|nr:response regulator transcription factor [Bryobacteraceae bacterium]
MGSQVAILYGEAHGLVIEGFRTIIARRHRIIGAVRDGLDLVDAALRLKPDLVVLAISLPRLNGIEAARLIKTKLPKTRILFLTRHDGARYIQAAMAAGGDGYLLKSDDPQCVLEAIRKVMAGQVYLSPQLSAEYLSHRRRPEEVAGKLQLSTRERQVLQQIAEGYSAKEVAWALRISVKTVSFHRENIKRKLGVRSTADLTRRAMELGLTSPPESA